jgi:hypothetical protein
MNRFQDGHGSGGDPVGVSPICRLADLFQGRDAGQRPVFSGIHSTDYRLQSQVVDLAP